MSKKNDEKNDEKTKENSKLDNQTRAQGSTENENSNDEQNSRPRSPGVFITNDPDKLMELPSDEYALNNRGPLNKNTTSPDLFKLKKDSIIAQNQTPKRSSNVLRGNNEPKYTVTRTPSNMSLNLTQPNETTTSNENTVNSTADSKPSVLGEQQSSEMSRPSQSKEPGEIIEIASEREATVRNYEIEQFRNDENDLKEQFSDLISKMNNLQKTLSDLEGRELEEVQSKRQEAENFERETREKIEQLQVRKEELDREHSRLQNRKKELKSLKRETDSNKNLSGKMRNEMGKCLRKLGKQYENGCKKYLKELQDMENEANDRRNRDRELMDQYKQKQNELAVLLEEKMILRKSLEERNQLEKLLGQNGISLLVANQNEQRKQQVGESN